MNKLDNLAMSWTDDTCISLWTSSLVIMYLHKEELGMEEGKRMSVWLWQVWVQINLYFVLIAVGGVTISWASADAAVTSWSAWTTLEHHSSLKLDFW